MIKLIAVLSNACEHPMIQQGSDGHWYCTECKAQVA